MNGPGDVIDLIIEQWEKEKPGLDQSATRILPRITRLYLLQTASFGEVFARHGLRFGEWEVLATLRRSGPPYKLRPTDLNDAVVLTSGAMTNRLDKLEKAGLVERQPDPADRRGTLVCITPKGRKVCDAAQAEHLANEERLLSGLTAAERDQLGGLLRKLLMSAPFRELEPHPLPAGGGTDTAKPRQSRGRRR